TTDFHLGANDDCLYDVALLHVAATNCTVDRSDNGVANACVGTLRATENTNGTKCLSTGVLRKPTCRLLVNEFLHLSSRWFSELSLAERIWSPQYVSLTPTGAGAPNADPKCRQGRGVKYRGCTCAAKADLDRTALCRRWIVPGHDAHRFLSLA